MAKTTAIIITALAPLATKLVDWGREAWRRRKAKKDRKRLEKIRESEGDNV